MNQTVGCERLRPQTFFMGRAADNPLDADHALALAAANGAIAAIGALYARHSRRVYALCLRMTHNTEDAEDLTQDVFIQLMRKIASFRGESQFTTWLHRLTVNQVLMYFRTVAARREKLAEDVEGEISASRESRDSMCLQVVDKIALDAALSSLPQGCRSILVLFDIEGYSHVEIAGLLGCSVGNSKSQLHKARMKLRLLLRSSGLRENAKLKM